MTKAEIKDRERLATLLKEAKDSPIVKTLRANKAAETRTKRRQTAERMGWLG
jgi:hypothetical protein